MCWSMPRPSADWQIRTDRAKEEIKKLKASLERLKGEAREVVQQKLHQAEGRLPPPLPTIPSVRDVASQRLPIHVLKRGDPDKPGRLVGPRAPGALLPANVPELAPDAQRPRESLARWINDPEHPLTARVLVNRVWQYHFGRGLVATPNDFGVNGSPPSHPELLDYLANEFVANGRRLKPLHRLIVLSSAYRQASRSADASAGGRLDPDDRLLWHFPRRRLEAEEVRDAMLAAAGRLNPKAGGPSVVVPVDRDLVSLLYDPAQWTVTPNEAEHRPPLGLPARQAQLCACRFRRSSISRIARPAVRAANRAPMPCRRWNCSTARPRTAWPTPSPIAWRCEAGADRQAQVELAYRLAAGREPNPRELELALTFLARQPLREFALVVFNLNAFLYVE